MPVPHEKIMQKNPLEICTTLAAILNFQQKKFQIDSEKKSRK